MSLSLQNLTVRRDGCPTVDHVTLSVPAGSFVGLIGPNGAGKTTLIGAVCGLLRPTGGTINAFGLDAQANWRQVRRRPAAAGWRSPRWP